MHGYPYSIFFDKLSYLSEFPFKEIHPIQGTDRMGSKWNNFRTDPKKMNAVRRIEYKDVIKTFEVGCNGFSQFCLGIGCKPEVVIGGAPYGPVNAWISDFHNISLSFK